MHVLIVEDQPTVADFLHRGLRAAGFAAAIARDGQAGLTNGLTTAYDALVIEDRLAIMDGRALLRELRKQGCRVPAILLTDRPTTGAELADEELARDIVVKPFAFPELVGRLHALVVRSRSHTDELAAALRPASVRQDREFQRLLDLTPYATLAIDDLHQVVGANWQAEQLFGYGQGVIIGTPIDLLLPEPSRGEQEQSTAHALARLGVSPQGVRYESTGVRRDRMQFRAEVSLTWLVGADGVLILATVRDITSHREGDEALRISRQQLRELSARLLMLREEEGARISRTIHDDLGQALTGLKMDLAWLKRHLPPDQMELLDKIRTMGELIDSTVQTVRRIATELRPGILDELGLVPAIEWELREFQRRSGVRCRLRCTLAETVLDTAGATTLFRIFQEALTNIARHAQADEVQVVVEEAADALVLRVQDNGRGISQAEIASAQSIGLLGMRERARLRGGDVQIQGATGAGTTVTAWLPLGPRAGS